MLDIIYIYTYICIIWICMGIQVYLNSCIYICIYIYIYINVCSYICIYMCNVYIHITTGIDKYILSRNITYNIDRYKYIVFIQGKCINCCRIFTLPSFLADIYWRTNYINCMSSCFFSLYPIKHITFNQFHSYTCTHG